MDTKRLATAFALSAAIFIAWSYLFPPPKPARPAPGKGPAATATAATAAPATGGPSPVPTTAAAPAADPSPTPGLVLAPVAATEARDVVVSTALYTARLSNQGGDLVSFQLSRFTDGTKQPLDLVRRSVGFPGRTLRLDGTDPFLGRAASALHTVETETVGRETRVRFHYREADGQGVVRTYVFRQGYGVSVELEREGRGSAALVIGPGLGNPSAEEELNKYARPGSPVALTAAGSVERKAKDGLKEALPLGRGLAAAGLEDNYFLTVALPAADAATTFRPVATSLGAGKGTAAEAEVVVAADGKLKAEVYLGPKDPAVLEAFRPGTERLIDYGWFPFLVRPLLWAIKEIHRFVGNWGLSIIVITILIRLVLYPLTHKQLVSMKRMSLLQPKMETLRAKWSTKIKTDPQARVKMNEEMMALYKTEGVNPMGGCLPMLPQLPILAAFYNLLAHAIELRHAPFIFWITDLSAKDPYYVTPILMTITMWAQQGLMPQTGDPAMRRVQAIMPFMFGFFFKDVPAGLVLYWLVQNVLAIAQQLVLDRFTDLGPSSMKKNAG